MQLVDIVLTSCTCKVKYLGIKRKRYTYSICIAIYIHMYMYHTRIQKVFSEGVRANFDYVYFFLIILFLVDEGREDSNTTINGPSLSASQTPFK